MGFNENRFVNKIVNNLFCEIYHEVVDNPIMRPKYEQRINDVINGCLQTIHVLLIDNKTRD